MLNNPPIFFQFNSGSEWSSAHCYNQAGPAPPEQRGAVRHQDEGADWLLADWRAPARWVATHRGDRRSSGTLIYNGEKQWSFKKSGQLWTKYIRDGKERHQKLPRGPSRFLQPSPLCRHKKSPNIPEQMVHIVGPGAYAVQCEKRINELIFSTPLRKVKMQFRESAIIYLWLPIRFYTLSKI